LNKDFVNARMVDSILLRVKSRNVKKCSLVDDTVATK